MVSGTLARKLRLKEGMRALVMAAPPGYFDLLTPLPDAVSISEVARGSYPFVQLFARNKSQLETSAPALLKHCAADTLLWISYPKKTSGVASDLSRDVVREIMAAFNWDTVAIISIDDVWSALRLRPTDPG